MHSHAMDWNVVVTVLDRGFDRAEAELGALGDVSRTPYFNVLVMRVDDVDVFLEELADTARMIPDLTESCLARVAPARGTFTFQSAEEFEEKGGAAAREVAPRLAGASFHVRMHRRGFGGELHSGEEERMLAGEIYDALEKTGAEEPSVEFDDPDAILAVETVDNRAGMSLWTREELDRYPFLEPD